jgi:hypothetical protein
MTTNISKSKLYYFTGATLSTIAVCPLLIIYLLATFISDPEMIAIVTNPIFGIFVLLLILALPATLSFLSVKKNKEELLEYYTIAILCYVVGYIMLFYGSQKLINKQFVVFYKGLDTKLSDVDSYTLTWYYYGRSNIQVFIMGLLEVLPSVLLLFRKTRFVGSIIMLPVILNVLVTNVFNRISPFTLFSVSLLTIFNIFIIYSYKNEIKELLRKINDTRILKTGNSSWRISIVMMKVVFWGFIIYSLGGSILNYKRNRERYYYGVGAYELTDLKINERHINLDSTPTTWYKKIYKESDVRYTQVITGKNIPEPANVIFNTGHDSLKIAFVHWGDNDNRVEDSAAVFNGTYQFNAQNELVVAGKQTGNKIEARYKKLPFKDYRWIW